MNNPQLEPHEQLYDIHDIPFYLVSNLGNVYSFRSGKLRKLSPHKSKNGAMYVNLIRDRENHRSKHRYKRQIDILVALNVLKIRQALLHPRIKHKNGDKTDNRSDNLEWEPPKTPYTNEKKKAESDDMMMKWE